jgi:hypothetical protein
MSVSDGGFLRGKVSYVFLLKYMTGFLELQVVL